MVDEVLFSEEGIPYLQLGAYKLHLEVEDLQDELLERSRQELRETPEVRAEAVQTLRKLLENEDDLIIPKDENDFLLKFLRPCKFYPDSAFKLMKRYYKFKLKNPKYSQDLTPSSLKQTISSGIANFIPNRDKTCGRIMTVHIGRKWNPKEVKLSEMFRAIMMFIEIAMVEPKTQLGGVQCIFDMDGLSMTQIYQFGPSFARTLLEWVQECIPLRLKGIHVVNEPRLFAVLFAIFKPFINEKLRKRIMFHGNHFEKLVESLGASSVPICYGGDMDIPEYPPELLAEVLCHYEEEFKKADAIGYSSKEKVISSS